jgi:hypothetical protein
MIYITHALCFIAGLLVLLIVTFVAFLHDNRITKRGYNKRFEAIDKTT